MTENTTRDIAALLRERVVPPGSCRHGLVIGIEQYRDPRLDLRCAANDAKAIFELMVDPNCGMFPESNVNLLLNEDATRDSIWKALSALRRISGENDTVWVYYAGHAAPEESILYWVTHDSDVDDLYGTALSSGQISKVLEDIRAKRLLVLLDCCHAVATAVQKNPTRAVLATDEIFSCYKGHGRITLASSDGKEKSIELSDVGHGVFTYFLERGLRGEADTDGDGIVTADELWQYLRSKVVDASHKVGNTQTPVLLGEMRHDFALSLNPLEFGRRLQIGDAIRSLVGVEDNQLTTEEGRICLELLRRSAQNEAERDLMTEFTSLLESGLRISTLRRLIDDVRETASSSTSMSPAPYGTASSPGDVEKADVVEVANINADCKIDCADSFNQLPAKYQWSRERTLNVINQWSSKHLGILSNMADRCEVIDVQAHGYFVWQAKVAVESREWIEYSLGVNVPNPSGPLEFLESKPPQIPKITPEITKRIAEICPYCHGTGEFVCPECFGEGEVQCKECRGVGMHRFNLYSENGYSASEKCHVCQGKKKLPCTSCKGVPRRLCTCCNGTGKFIQSHFKTNSFPETRTTADLWSVEANSTLESWSLDDEILLGPNLNSVSHCKNCKGTGEFVCPECFGEGEVQCKECRGVGMHRFNLYSENGYSASEKCHVCQGKKKLPCTSCKGVPKRECDMCRGSGVVAVYQAIAVSRDVTKPKDTSVEQIGYVGDKYTIPLASIDGDAKAVPHEAVKLLDRFEGAEALRDALVYSPKDKNARITRVKADLSWYPYILCKMKDVESGMEFIIGISCICRTVFQVQGKFPKGEGLWSWLFGWASQPFDETFEEESKFMLKQIEQDGEHTNTGVLNNHEETNG